LTLVKEAKPLKVTGVGQKVTFTYLVTNVGSVDVTDLVIDETVFTGKGTLVPSTCGAATLAPGESTNCTTTYTITQADMALTRIDNTAVASGVVTNPQQGTEDVVSNSSSASVTITVPPGPVIPTGGWSVR